VERIGAMNKTRGITGLFKGYFVRVEAKGKNP
jgi:hypothetical protein